MEDSEQPLPLLQLRLLQINNNCNPNRDHKQWMRMNWIN